MVSRSTINGAEINAIALNEPGVLQVEIQASASIGLSAAVTGTIRRPGAVSAGFSVGANVKGSAVRSGHAAGFIGLSATSTGRRRVIGTVAASVTLSASLSGLRRASLRASPVISLSAVSTLSHALLAPLNDNQTWFLPAENREYDLPPESRGYTVPVDDDFEMTEVRRQG